MVKYLLSIVVILSLWSCEKEETYTTGSAARLGRPLSILNKPGTNSWYNNTLDDSLAVSLTAAKKDVDWMDANRFSPEAQYAILYISSSLIRSSNFPLLASYAYSKNVRLGVAYSSTSKIDDIINYNIGKPVDQKIWIAVSEIEPYNTGDYAGMTTVLTYAYPRLKANGITNIVYMGWPTTSYWSTIISNSDQINLHIYKTSSGMTPSGLWSYVRGRLGDIASAAAALKKIVPINIIYSCEPAFAYTYFQSYRWEDAHLMFMDQFNTYATTQMKQNLTVNNFSVFVTRYGKEIK
jgi:hypothetical protein